METARTVSAVRRFWAGKEEVTLRHPLLGDCAGMLECVNSLVLEKAYIARQTMKTWEDQEADLLELLKQEKEKACTGLMVDIGGRLAGWAGIGYSGKTNNRVGMLGVVWLIKEARGRGIAEKLLRALICETRRVLRVDTLRLETFACNLPAIELYKRIGFMEVPRKSGTARKTAKHYGKQLPRIEMQLFLS